MISELKDDEAKDLKRYIKISFDYLSYVIPHSCLQASFDFFWSEVFYEFRSWVLLTSEEKNRCSIFYSGERE